MTRKKTEEHIKQIDFQYVISLILRRRKVFTVPAVVVFLVSAGLIFFLPKQYEASSTILISTKQIVDPLVQQLAVSPDITQELNTLSKKVLAWPRLELLVNELHMADDLDNPLDRENFIKRLQKRITVQLKGGELINISYLDQDPPRAQDMVNKLTSSFINENMIIKKEEVQTAINFIQEQLNIYRDKLENSQKDFSHSKVDAEIRSALNRRWLLEDRIAKLQKLIPSQVTREQNPVIAQLQMQLGGYESELARLMIDAREGNPKVAELKKITSEIKRKIDEEKEKETVKESVSITNPMYLQADQELKQIEMQLNYLYKRKNELKKPGNKIEKPITEEALSTLERNKQVDEDIYQVLLRQLESAYVSERLQDSEKGGRFRVIEYARLPLQPVKPDKLKMLLMGLFLGLLCGAGCVAGAEYMDKSFVTVKDAQDTLPMEYIGVVSRLVLESPREQHSLLDSIGNGFISLLATSKLLSFLDIIPTHVIKKKNTPSDISPYAVMHHEPHSIVSQEYRVIRNNILGLCLKKPFKSIMITSSGMQEGKTITSLNLAIALALSGRSTLLIDGDLRKGSLGRLVNKSQPIGFIDVIKMNLDIISPVLKTSIENLFFLPRGNPIPEPSEVLMKNEAFIQKSFDKLKQKYDSIIVDSSPVINLPDSSIIGRFVDTVVLVVKMEHTQKEIVLNTHKSLLQSGATIAGYILTNARYYLPKYLYHNYYYYPFVQVP